jgi:hypothetical protein
MSAWRRPKNLNRIEYKVSVSARCFAIRALAPILQPNTRRPALLMRAPHKMPYSRVKTVKKDWPSNIRTLKNLRNPVRHRIRLCEVLQFDFYQNAQSPSAIRERHKSLGVLDRGQARFDAHTHAAQQVDNCGSVMFREIDGSIVGQYPPRRNGSARPLRVALNPRGR